MNQTDTSRRPKSVFFQSSMFTKRNAPSKFSLAGFPQVARFDLPHSRFFLREHDKSSTTWHLDRLVSSNFVESALAREKTLDFFLPPSLPLRDDATRRRLGPKGKRGEGATPARRRLSAFSLGGAEDEWAGEVAQCRASESAKLFRVQTRQHSASRRANYHPFPQLQSCLVIHSDTEWRLSVRDEFVVALLWRSFEIDKNWQRN